MAKSKMNLSASVQAKNGRLYAVIQVKENGKTKPVWRALGLPEDTGKSKVQRVFREVVNQFEEDYAAELERRDHPANDIPVYDYMVSYLKKVEPNLQKSTYVGYQNLVNGKIQRYFQKHPDLTLGNLKPKDIEAFYQAFYDEGTSAATVIHYHALLRKAFQIAFKTEMIDANPFDRIERPKKSKFQGGHYSEEELNKLLEVTRAEAIYPAIMLAGGLGMRRSEALGVRWSRIDWEKKTVLLDTKILCYEQEGESVVEMVEEMKNKTSRRTLPIPEPVLEMLKEEKEKQEMYKRLFKKSYNQEYEDYVCVDNLGNILRPDYVTRRFGQLLKENNLRKIRFHDLRHTFASILLGKDVPLINVSNFLGHSDISTTANIYAHLDKASKQASADVMTEVLSGNK